MTEKLNIVCLKWGTLYGPEYVNRLYRGVYQNLNQSFEFHCFTDNTSGIIPDVITHPLQYKNLSGWWNKLYLFSNKIPLDGRILFIDLDTLITGPLDDIVNQQDDFIVLRDFFTGIARSVVGNDNVGSGLMLFNAKKHSHIWESFIANPEQAIAQCRPHGDQRWIQLHQEQRTYWQDIIPGQVVSFKVHCREGLPHNARIVCYHGIPNIPDSIVKTTRVPWWTINPQPWVREYWRDA